ncbi:hypothetical protein FKW77_009456 [Venturia effusa]|uniref:Uncharacterized protein n=1 Tax=Venturia effusa TaxID=50376 RepID=A0A517L9Z7_9PEZI|nr:hypothetical protein FKW77_009456 [Venturia effusa]
MTERYQGWTGALPCDGREDATSSSIEQTFFHSGFTAINRQQQEKATQLNNSGEVGSHPNADADVNISHAAKHPIVAQYLGIGLDDADNTRFGRQATMPPATSKMRPHATSVSASPVSKQIKETGKKRSATAPPPKPAKKTNRARSDNDHATAAASASASKITARTSGKKKNSSAAAIESNKENAVVLDSGLQREALPSKSFVLSEQTAQKLKAWNFQPSPPAVTESTVHVRRSTDHQNDTRSSSNPRSVVPVSSIQPTVSSSSTVGSEPDTNCSTSSQTPLTSSIVTPATHESQFVRFSPAISPRSARKSLAAYHSLPSPVTHLNVTNTQGNDHLGYSSPSTSVSDNRMTNSKPRADSGPALTLPCQPPTNGHNVLETIFEEGPPSPMARARELFGPLSESSHLLNAHSTEPSSTTLIDVDSPFANDVFDDLDDEDLLDLDLTTGLRASSPSEYQPVQTLPPLHHRIIDQDIIDLVSDDEWNILEDEEIAFMDLTDDTAHSARPASIAEIHDRSRAKTAQKSLANTTDDTSKPQPQSPPSHQVQTSPQHSTITAAEATEDYINAIIHPPILRPPFPNPIRDHSPLIGVTPSLTLKTCFRIGECLNVGCTSARTSNTQSSDAILIELYAKVVSSHRDPNGVTQHFLLADLFHEKRGPFLDAACETWRGSELWEYDCARFLCAREASGGEKKLCRAVGRMKRECGGKWRFVVLNIWEATWEDVEFVRGIVCGS